MNIKTQTNVEYESQQEFAEHLEKMLKDGYILGRLSIPKKNKDCPTAYYMKKEEAEE